MKNFKATFQLKTVQTMARRVWKWCYR